MNNEQYKPNKISGKNKTNTTKQKQIKNRKGINRIKKQIYGNKKTNMKQNKTHAQT